MFPRRNIHKCTWTSPDGKNHNQIDQMLIDNKWNSSVLEVRSFKGVDCDTDRFVVVAKVRELLAVSKEAAQSFDEERFNVRKLNELEVRKQYQVETANWFAALENISDDEDINRDWENIEENLKTPAKENLVLQELKQHKAWFGEECLGILGQRKQTKLQWIHDPSERSEDNLSNVTRVASGHFGKNRRHI